MNLGTLQLAVHKYSHAEQKGKQNDKADWTHDTRTGLFVVLERAWPGTTFTLSENNDLVMKIMCGLQTLEYVNLQELCRLTHSEVQLSKNRGLTLRKTDLPTIALCKAPFVQIRYFVANGKTRRIQLKLASDEDWTSFIQVLQAIDFPIDNQSDSLASNSRSKQNSQVQDVFRPVTAPARGTLGDASLARAVTSATTMPSSQHWNTAQDYWSSRPSSSSITLGRPSAGPNSSSPMRSDNMSYHTAGSSLPSPERFIPPAGQPDIRTEQYCGPQRTWTSPIIVNDAGSGRTRPHASAVSSTLLDRPPILPASANRHYSSGAAIADNGPWRWSDNPGPTFSKDRRLPMMQTFDRHAVDSNSYESQSYTTGPVISAMPSVSQMPETLTPLLPPKRVLPFDKRPSSLRSPTNCEEPQAPAKPYSTALPCPVLSKPAHLNEQDPRPACDQQHTRDVQVLPTGPQSCPQVSTQPLVVEQYPLNRTSIALQSLELNIAPQQNRVVDRTERPTIQDDIQPLKRPLPDNEEIAPNKRIACASDIENAPPASTVSPHNTADTRLSSPADPAMSETAILHAYTAQPDAERIASLDRIICKHIYDPAFLKLCEDLENVWRRIGLEPPNTRL